MPMISMKDLGGMEVKPGDKIEFSVKKIDGDMVELSYDNPEVESQEESEDMMDAKTLRAKMVEKHGETDSEGM